MRLTAGKLLLIALVPVALYGAIKAVMYFNAKQVIDDMISQVSDQADISYGAIRTEVLKSVAIEGIRVRPAGSLVEMTIDRVRLDSGDPWFFITKGDWQPGRDAPPKSLGFQIDRLSVPVTDDMMVMAGLAGNTTTDVAAGTTAGCDAGLQLDAPLLRSLGIDQLVMDADGGYRIDELAQTIEVGMGFELAGIQSVDFDARLTGLDMESFGQGAMPSVELGRMKMAFAIPPEFGERALRACAAADGETPEAWSERLADQALQGLQLVGMTLGPGLEDMLRRFYRDWGEVEIVAAPAQPVGIMSVAFLPPDRLFDALGISVALNDRVVTDTGFTLQQPDASLVAALLGQGRPNSAADPTPTPPRETRVILRRAYEDVAVAELGRYRDHHVRIRARGDLEREGLLKAIVDGVAEVEQSLHGGKYSAFVPVSDIQSVSVLIERRVAPAN
jgi:hypothetical protein